LGLKTYVVRRLLEAIPVVLFVIIINFTLIHLAPGDPATALAGEQATREMIEATAERYGLNKPIYEQLWIYITGIARGDLGVSYTYTSGTPVISLIAPAAFNTLILVIPVMVLSFGLGTALGVYGASNHPSKRDTTIVSTSLVLYSMPTFWTGLLLLLVFGLYLGVFPLGGISSATQVGWTTSGPAAGIAYFLDEVWHAVLPIVTLTCFYTPVYLRLSRSSVMEVMREEFITAARAKGLEERTVFFRHALRNAILPSVTMLGLWVGLALTSASLTEIVFGWPGLGRLLYESIFSRDYPVLMGIFVTVSMCVIVATLITDVVCAWLDPRIVYK
jgi:peptide/nickel transport system permease protein